MASPAFAAGSPLCELQVSSGDCVITYAESLDCCECVDTRPGLTLAEALAACADEGRCTEQLRTCGEEEEEPPPPNPPPPGERPRGRDSGVPTVFPAGQ